MFRESWCSWAMRRKGVPEKMVRIIRELYRGAKTAVRTGNGVSKYFAVEVGLRQGFALSPVYFHHDNGRGGKSGSATRPVGNPVR